VADVTLAIAACGLLLSALSLGWQAATFFLSGARVVVRLREGFRGPGGVMIGPPMIYTQAGLAALERDGFTEHVLAVEVVNRGRLPATVNSWSIAFGNGVIYRPPLDAANPALPYRLEPGASEIWYAAVEPLQQLQPDFADQTEQAARARGRIGLGTRDALMSRNGIIIGPDGTRLPQPGLVRRSVAYARRQVAAIF
jgi:hypothetical protein